MLTLDMRGSGTFEVVDNTGGGQRVLLSSRDFGQGGLVWQGGFGFGTQRFVARGAVRLLVPTA